MNSEGTQSYIYMYPFSPQIPPGLHSRGVEREREREREREKREREKREREREERRGRERERERERVIPSSQTPSLELHKVGAP